MDKNIKTVRDGYAKATQPYYENKDKDQDKIPLFLDWLNRNENDTILELGCGSGFPIGKTVLETGKKYTGIDLSEEQIKLSHKLYPQWKKHFKVAEMLDFCRKSRDESYSGIVSMFSIRHLPRIYHVELYVNLYRMLKPGGQLLIDITDRPDDGEYKDWLGGSTMYWSGFSEKWTRITLEDIGFIFVEDMIDEKTFLDEIEKTLFVVYRK